MIEDDLEVQDVADSRDVISRIDYLESLEDDEIGDTEAEELEDLRAFAEQAQEYVSDWNYGATLVNEDYFVTYAEELAGDVLGIDYRPSWPYNYIDWEAAADALKEDYSELEYRGTTFLYAN